MTVETMTTKSRFAKAALLEAYFNERALASIGQAAPFQIGKFKLGKDLLQVGSDGKTEIAPIDGGLTSISNIFFEGDPVLTYANGRITIRCTLPRGAITGDPVEYSCTGLYTAGDTPKLIAVLAGLPATLTADDSFVIEGYIDNVLHV